MSKENLIIKRRDKEILKKRRDGWPVRLIADFYNLSPSRVVAILKKENFSK